MDLVKRAWEQDLSSEAWKSGYVWLAWGVIGGLLPLWGTAFLLLLLNRNIELFGLLKNGEFVLYAASFIAGSMYTIRRDVFPSRTLINILFYFLLGITLLTFAAITIANVTTSSTSESMIPILISKPVLTCISLGVFGFTTLLCLLVTVVEQAGAGFDVPAALKKDQKTLEDAFEKLQEADDGQGGDK